jgi:hypothetical protein
LWLGRVTLSSSIWGNGTKVSSKSSLSLFYAAFD